MAYRAQMVIRTKDADSAKVLDDVKKLAEERGQTISELAIELFSQGLSGRPVERESSDKEEAPVVVTPEPVKEPIQHPKSPEARELPRPTKVLADDQTEAFAEQAVRLVVTEGVNAATDSLREFFQNANPAQAGRLREDLQEQLRGKEFEDLFEALRETDEYKGYRRRVVYG